VASSSPRVLASQSVDQIKNANAQIGTPPLTEDGSSYHSYGPPSNLGGPSGWFSFDVHEIACADSKKEFAAPHEYDYRHPYEVPHQALYQYPSHPQHVHGERTHFEATPGHYYSSQSPYTSSPLSGSFKTSPQVNTHQFRQPSPRGSDFAWTNHPPVRSMSIADTDDLHSMYPAYRSNTFPYIPQRVGISAAIPHFPPGHPGIFQPGSQHSSYSSQFPPSGYQQMPAPSTMAWSSSIPTQLAPVPSSSSDSYNPGWYAAPSNLPYVREEDDSAHGIHPHGHDQQRFRPNPG
jgi:hypothetical protein